MPKFLLSFFPCISKARFLEFKTDFLDHFKMWRLINSQKPSRCGVEAGGNEGENLRKCIQDVISSFYFSVSWIVPVRKKNQKTHPGSTDPVSQSKLSGSFHPSNRTLRFLPAWHVAKLLVKKKDSTVLRNVPRWEDSKRRPNFLLLNLAVPFPIPSCLPKDTSIPWRRSRSQQKTTVLWWLEHPRSNPYPVPKFRTFPWTVTITHPKHLTRKKVIGGEDQTKLGDEVFITQLNKSIFLNCGFATLEA